VERVNRLIIFQIDISIESYTTNNIYKFYSSDINISCPVAKIREREDQVPKKQ